MIAAFILVILSLLLLLSYSKDMWRLQRERPENIKRWEAINGIRGLQDWIWWTTARYYYTLKTVILIRILSAYSGYWKGLFAVGLATISYSVSEESSMVAAATVFYASLLFLEDRFSYAALYPLETDAKRIREGDKIDSVFCEIDIINKGDKTARYIETEMKIVDPIRTLSVDVWDSNITTKGSSLDEPLESNLSRTIEYGLDVSGEEIRDRIRKKGFNNRLGGLPWAVITIRTPDGLSSTKIYEPLPDSEVESIDDLLDVFNMMSKLFN